LQPPNLLLSLQLRDKTLVVTTIDDIDDRENFVKFLEQLTKSSNEVLTLVVVIPTVQCTVFLSRSFQALSQGVNAILTKLNEMGEENRKGHQTTQEMVREGHQTTQQIFREETQTTQQMIQGIDQKIDKIEGRIPATETQPAAGACDFRTSLLRGRRWQ
jgi:uncharacterized phage infection (PIP) family protein YhgE